jgi:hypothetical protein
MGWMSGFRIPSRANIYIFLRQSSDRFCGSHSFLHVPGAPSWRIKRPGSHADNSPPTNAEVKNLSHSSTVSQISSWRGASLCTRISLSSYVLLFRNIVMRAVRTHLCTVMRSVRTRLCTLMRAVRTRLCTVMRAVRTVMRAVRTRLCTVMRAVLTCLCLWKNHSYSHMVNTHSIWGHWTELPLTWQNQQTNVKTSVLICPLNLLIDIDPMGWRSYFCGARLRLVVSRALNTHHSAGSECLNALPIPPSATVLLQSKVPHCIFGNCWRSEDAKMFCELTE